MNRDKLLDMIEASYKHAGPGTFRNTKEALVVVGSALRYLTNQCEDMDDREVPELDDDEK